MLEQQIPIKPFVTRWRTSPRPNTIATYRATYFCDLTEEFVDEYTFYLQKRGAENGHNGNVRSYLRLFTGLVYYAPRMANVPDADLRIFERVRPKMKPTQFNPRTIPLDVVEKIKNIDLFLFTYYTGMANVDVCYLTWDCIYDEGILMYERTKYPKTAILPFVDKAHCCNTLFIIRCVNLRNGFCGLDSIEYHFRLAS